MTVNRKLTYQQLKTLIEPEKLYTPFEVEKLGIVSQTWVYDRVKKGKLRSTRIGQRISAFYGSDLLLTMAKDPYFFKRTSDFKELIKSDPEENNSDIESILGNAEVHYKEYYKREIEMLLSIHQHFKSGVEFTEQTLKKLNVDLKAA